MQMVSLDTAALILLIVLPMGGAALLMLIPGRFVDVIRWVSFSIATIVLLITVYVFLGFDHTEGAVQFRKSYDWLPMPGPWGEGERAITLALGVDGIAVLMVLLTGIVMFTGTLLSWNVKDSNKDFFVLYFLLLSGVFVGVKSQRRPSRLLHECVFRRLPSQLSV